MSLNKLSIIKNPYQGNAKKVLCVCTVGLLRSPTCAEVLSQSPYNFNTRSAGIDPDFAIVPVTKSLLDWCDEIVVMESKHERRIKELTDKPIINLNIEDVYEYRNPDLIKLIKGRYIYEKKEISRDY